MLKNVLLVVLHRGSSAAAVDVAGHSAQHVLLLERGHQGLGLRRGQYRPRVGDGLVLVD